MDVVYNDPLGIFGLPHDDDEASEDDQNDDDFPDFWRAASNFVSLVDFMLPIVHVGMFLIKLAILLYSGRTMIYEEKKWIIVEGGISTDLIVFVAVNIIYGIVNMWYAAELVSATDKTTPIEESAAKGKRWMNFKIIALFMEVSIAVYTANETLAVVEHTYWFLIKITAIVIVRQFLQELEHEMNKDDDD